MHVLYYTPRTCALASHIALEEAGVDHELRKIDFGASEQQSDNYLKVNPKARVPALVTPRGVLTETPAILAYIAQINPDAGLAPLDDAFAFAEIQAINSYLCSTLHVAHAHRMRGSRWASEDASFEDMKRNAPRAISACYDLIETTMFRGPWVMGETYTIADPYLFTVAEWIEGDGVDPARIPRIIEHRARMAERPAVRKAIAAERGA
ncbi:glutathione S-transferase [Pikeienuella piscinae]|uniref:Glutathione S-transferase n=1 Tax=Pikeienuella piscinae TaxID=2748098 RepID=A0A7M3T5B3_9RHOB|nr:glutathione S-transferase N-terminal domain-containing protein [Pikeienuella piscinae]QIE57194.1 glutathione S-transferase [Pikeienuella piscinae]